MNDKQVNELVSFGEFLEVKVTPFCLNGRNGVHIRDLEFFYFIPAALYLKQIQAIELRDDAFLVA